MADFGIVSAIGGGFSGLGGFGAGFMEHKSPTTVLPKLVEPAQIGDYLECDVILSRTTDFSAEVTEYPVEDGFSISDHCIRKPLKLQLEVLFTPTPVTWWNAAFGGKLHTLNRVINAIMDIWKKGEPVTIKLVDAIYEDMTLKDIRIVYRKECLRGDTVTIKTYLQDTENGKEIESFLYEGETIVAQVITLWA